MEDPVRQLKDLLRRRRERVVEIINATNSIINNASSTLDSVREVVDKFKTEEIELQEKIDRLFKLITDGPTPQTVGNRAGLQTRKRKPLELFSDDVTDNLECMGEGVVAGSSTTSPSANAVTRASGGYVIPLSTAAYSPRQSVTRGRSGLFAIRLGGSAPPFAGVVTGSSTTSPSANAVTRASGGYVVPLSPPAYSPRQSVTRGRSRSFAIRSGGSAPPFAGNFSIPLAGSSAAVAPPILPSGSGNFSRASARSSAAVTRSVPPIHPAVLASASPTSGSGNFSRALAGSSAAIAPTVLPTGPAVLASPSSSSASGNTGSSAAIAPPVLPTRPAVLASPSSSSASGSLYLAVVDKLKQIVEKMLEMTLPNIVDRAAFRNHVHECCCLAATAAISQSNFDSTDCVDTNIFRCMTTIIETVQKYTNQQK